MSSTLNQPQQQNGPFPEWYTPSANDSIERIEIQQISTEEVIQITPTLVPQVKLGLETERVIPQWENVSVNDLQKNTNIDNLWGKGRQQTLLNISPLEEGAKAHGDKFRSDFENAENVRNARDWREVCEPNKESAKFHGDALFESNIRPAVTRVIEEREPVQLQDESSFKNEFSQDLPKDEFINKSLTDLRSNSEILDRNSWSPNLRTFDEKNGSEELVWTENALKSASLENKTESTLSSTTSTTTTAVDSSSVDLLFPASLQEIHRLEENERSDRISRGVDPILLGKHHKFQHELLHHHVKFLHHISTTTATATETPSSPNTLTSSLEVIKEKTLTWSSFLKSNVKSIYDVAKDSLGMNPSSLSHITKEEEKERTRKMSEKIDPMLDARKRRVEEELLTSIKIAS